MRKTLLLVTLPLLLTGCPAQEATEQSVAGQRIDEALATMARAQAGYVPYEDGQVSVPLQQYRQQTLARNVDVLRQVIASGSPSQRTAARRLLADIHASAARQQTRQAGTEAAALANRSGTLMSYLVAVDKAQARSVEFATDFAPAVEALEEQRRGVQAQAQTLRGQLQSRQAQLAELDGHIEQLRQRSRDAMAQSQRHQAEAFELTGEARFDRYDQATAADREGNRLLYEAQQHQTQRDNVASDAKVIERQLEAAQKQAEALAAAIGEFRTRQENSQQQRAAAEADRDQAAQALVDEFNTIAQHYDARVADPMQKALDRAAEAVALMDEAVAQTSGPGRQAVQVDLLSKLLDQLYVQCEYIGITGEYARSLSNLTQSAPNLVPNHAPLFTGQRDQIVQRQQRLVEDTLAVLTRADELAGQLQGQMTEADAQSVSLATQVEALQAYRQQIQSARVQ